MATPGAAIHRDVEQRFRDLEDAVRRLSNPALRIRGTNLVTITPGPGVAVDAEDKLNPIISTSVQAWNQDQGVALEDGSPVVVVLSFYPNENTLHVTQNGEYLLPSEWSLDGNYLTVAPTSVRKILAGDVFAAAYWYDSLAETPPLPLDFTTEVMAVQPALWAGLGDTSGTSAVDSSGNSRTGTYGGTVALGEDALAPGLPGSSVDLLGTGWVEYAPGAAWQRPAAFSAGIWCKPTGASSAYLFCADDASTNDSDRIWNLSAQGAVRVYKSTHRRHSVLSHLTHQISSPVFREMRTLRLAL